MHPGPRASGGCNLSCAHLATCPAGQNMPSLRRKPVSLSQRAAARSGLLLPISICPRGDPAGRSVCPPSMIPLTNVIKIVARAPRKGHA